MTPTHLQQTYFQILQQQQFVAEVLDYQVFENHKPLLHTLATLGNSGVSVFDMFQKTHVFYSPNFGNLLGYPLHDIEKNGGSEFLDTKIHPEDWLSLTKNGISLLKLFFQFSSAEKKDYKLVNEYRIRNSEEKYVRVVEQHQVLELDVHGNLWLSLSIVDISPNQEINEGIKSQLLNFKTGKIIPFQEETAPAKKEELSIALTQREKQVLQLVKEGLLSKEISDKLFISLHTVNTHRQRVLEKLGANNSMEAVVYASQLGLV